MNSTSPLAAEEQQFADSVAQYLPYLNRFVGKLTGYDQMVEDVVQQTVLKALTHADQLRSESTLKAWLTSIAVNEVYQAYRRAWRSRVVPLMREPVDADRSQRPGFSNNAHEEQERDSFVRNAVSQLPEMYRSVVELCDLQCIPMNEVAGKLGLTLSAVKTRRHRARKKLRRLVASLNRS